MGDGASSAAHTPGTETSTTDSAGSELPSRSVLGQLNPLGQIQGQLHGEATRLRRLIEVVRLISRDLIFRSPLPRMAAALAFRTIFGLIPIVVLGLVVLGEVISDEQLESEISRLLDFAGISQIVNEDRARNVEETLEADRVKAGATGGGLPQNAVPAVDSSAPDPAEPAPAEPDPAAPDPTAIGKGRPNSGPESDTGFNAPSSGTGARAPPAGASLDPEPGGSSSTDPVQSTPEGIESSRADASTADSNPADGTPADLEAWIKELIQRVRDVSLRAVGFVGALVLIYAAFTLIREIERSFNQIYGATAGRTWLSSIFVYWTTITLGGLLLVGTFYAGDWLARQLAVGFIGRGAIEVGITTFITMALLTLAYIGLPNTRVDLRAAIGGAFVATLAWLALKSGFGLYLQAATGYERLYGEIGLIPLFLFWVYMTWLVVLFGLQVSYAFQTFSVWRERTLRARSTRVDFVDPTALIGVAATLARQFERGKPATISDLARSVGIAEGAAADLVDLLTDAGVAIRLSDEGDDARYALARPAESIGTVDLLKLTEVLITTEANADGAAVVARLRTSLRQQWDGTSLADLIAAAPATHRASRKARPGSGRGRRDSVGRNPEPTDRPQNLAGDHGPADSSESKR